MTRAAVRVHRWRGAAAVTLRSGALEATFLPELNLLGASLRLAGEEFLALPGGLDAYRRRHTTGLPLLAPWANRLGELRYQSEAMRVDLRGLDLHVDGRGLPIHGTMSAGDAWEVVSLEGRGRWARLRARFDYGSTAKLAAFPFPHLLETSIEVDGRSLEVATSLTPTSDRAVPVSFGYHPYLRLPRSRRAQWRLRLPKRRRIELDEHGLPTGVTQEAPAEADPIGSRVVDDLYELGDGRTFALEAAGRRVSVRYGSGFTHAQVFVSPGAGFVCLEPMTAPTNALVTGQYVAVGPGETFVARFRIRPERTAPDAV